MTDYAHTRHAEENRAARAKTLAAFAWERGLLSDDVELLDAATLRRLARDAGLRPPKDGSATWGAMLDLLVRRELWDAGHPDDPRAVRPYTAVRAEYLPHSREQNRNRPDETPGQGVTEILCPVDSPRGWDLIVAEGPLPGPVGCAFPTGPRATCSRPAVAWTPMSAGPDCARCAQHPPTGSQWGAGLAWVPKRCLLPMACYCHRHPGGSWTSWRPSL